MASPSTCSTSSASILTGSRRPADGIGKAAPNSEDLPGWEQPTADGARVRGWRPPPMGAARNHVGFVGFVGFNVDFVDFVDFKL